MSTSGANGHTDPSLVSKLVSLQALYRTLKRSVRCLDSDRILLWSHHGFGDQVTVVPAVESWAQVVPQVILPTKPMYGAMTRDMYGYLGNVTVLDLPSDDPERELEGVRSLSNMHDAQVVDGGRSVYAWARDAFPEFGIFRALNMALLHGECDLSSEAFKAHLLALHQRPGPEVPYAFVDHHPGTHREIPEFVLREIEERGLVIVHNQRDVSLLSLIALMDQAEELHLVTSSPMCLALTADLGSGLRVKYRHYNLHPLKLDYSLQWHEVKLTDEGSTVPVNRVEDALSFDQLERPFLSKVARSFFVRAAARMMERARGASRD